MPPYYTRYPSRTHLCLAQGLTTCFTRCSPIRNLCMYSVGTVNICRKPRFAISTMVRGRGAFIVLEGLDRSGKTTQTTELVQRIEKLGRPCKLIKFPSTPSLSRLTLDRTTTIGKMIDAYLRSAEDLDDRVIHLLFSANRWEARYAIQDDEA